MANSVLCTKCENWVRGKCAKIKRVTARLAMHFVCLKCKGIMEGTMDSIEKLGEGGDSEWILLFGRETKC